MFWALFIIYTVNGGWGGWSNWSACAVTCGTSNQTRSTSCNNPKPSTGGRDCSGGESIELRTCTADDCQRKGNTFLKHKERIGYVTTSRTMMHTFLFCFETILYFW